MNKTSESDSDPVQMLITVLQDGDKGYKGEITGFDPVPTAENSYLWDDKKRRFKGHFIDESGSEKEVYEFTIQLKANGSMVRSYRRVFSEEE